MPHAADSKWCARCGHRLVYTAVFLGHLGGWECPACGNRRPALDVSAAAIEQEGLEACSFTLQTPLGERRVRLPVAGMYNVYNALAAAAAAHALGGVELDRMVSGLERFDPAFGRFERVSVGGDEALLLLVKNPAGANEVLRTLALDERPKRLLMGLNDRIADGRDVSWIWDVDFELMAPAAAGVVTTGTRAAEMALRLAYAGVDDQRMIVQPDLEAALDRALAGGDGPLYLLATYTAMLDLRGILADRGIVRPYWETE
jgi:UDP-N-acetylmuramyl tripeptide synthase